MNRLTFFRAALTHGWGRVRHPVENVSLLLARVALFGLPTTLGFLRDSGLAGLGAGIAIGAVALFFEGAFSFGGYPRPTMNRPASFEPAANPGARPSNISLMCGLRAGPRSQTVAAMLGPLWSASRQDSRCCRNPPTIPRPERQLNGTTERRLAGTCLTFAISGERLFDALVARQSLRDLDRNRNLIRHPKNIAQIDEAVRIIQLGEFGDLRWNPA